MDRPSPGLFPYRVRPGQEPILAEVAALASRGGSLLIHAPTGSGKTVAVLAPLLEHAEAADHKVLYLVRTHSQEVQVLQEARAIAHRLERPLLALGLQGRAKRCLLLENDPRIKGATAEEHGKLCADRKRATERGFAEGRNLTVPPELPEGGTVDLLDLDGCVYYARTLQADLEAAADRIAAKLPSPPEFERYCADENLCAYELSKRLLPGTRLVTAPYAFFFQPFVRRALLSWMGVGLDRIDLVVDEAHNVPEYLRELTSVALPQVSIRQARAELAERVDFQLPEGPLAGQFLDIVHAAVEELVQGSVRDEDAILPPNEPEDSLLTALGGTSHRLDTWLGALATWGENLREEHRRARELPRSRVESVALTLLNWPRLDADVYVKVATRTPRPALEAYALDASIPAAPVRECHLSVHMSGTLAPTEEYRDSLGLGEECRAIEVPSHFPPGNVKHLYDPGTTTRYETLRAEPHSVVHLADRLASVLEALPVKTAVFFPSFELMDRVLNAGLQSHLPANTVLELKRLPSSDLWRSIDGFRKEPGGGVILGVAGGRIAEGIDFPDQDLEAVVIVGIPYPKPTAKRNALRQYLDARTGRGWEYAFDAPARRAILQAEGRMIRSEHDRGIGIILDRRAVSFAAALPGLEPIANLAETARAFYGHRARWTPSSRPGPAPAGGEDAALPGPGERL